MKLTCADPTCDRPPMRERDGHRWCMWHPEHPAPDMDMLTGKLRGPDGKAKPDQIALEPVRPKRRQTPKPSKPLAPRRRPTRPVTTIDLPPEPKPAPADVAEAYEAAADLVLQAELEELEATDPVVAAAAASYDRAVDSILARPAPGPRARREPPVDEAEAARRYQAGEGLEALAASLGIGKLRLRKILTGQGVQVRGRGEVVGQRGKEPRSFDPDEAERLYREGLDSAEVARHLGVAWWRVREVLRHRGVLKAQPGTFRPLDVDEARRLYASGLTLGEVARTLAVRTSRVADALREFGELRPQGHTRRAAG